MNDLRSRAEALVQSGSNDELEAMVTWDMKKLIQELHVYQTELQMQNEQLFESTAEFTRAHNKYIALYDYTPVDI
ncbi:MAG TPA: hypothetical protein VEC36_10805 [Patescibacteria group bacterium]|nr:hypothetical protein [Patescibacteria group bacterium]